MSNHSNTPGYTELGRGYEAIRKTPAKGRASRYDDERFQEEHVAEEMFEDSDENGHPTTKSFNRPKSPLQHEETPSKRQRTQNSYVTSIEHPIMYGHEETSRLSLKRKSRMLHLDDDEALSARPGRRGPSQNIRNSGHNYAESSLEEGEYTEGGFDDYQEFENPAKRRQRPPVGREYIHPAEHDHYKSFENDLDASDDIGSRRKEQWGVSRQVSLQKRQVGGYESSKQYLDVEDGDDEQSDDDVDEMYHGTQGNNRSCIVQSQRIKTQNTDNRRTQTSKAESLLMGPLSRLPERRSSLQRDRVSERPFHRSQSFQTSRSMNRQDFTNPNSSSKARGVQQRSSQLIISPDYDIEDLGREIGPERYLEFQRAEVGNWLSDSRTPQSRDRFSGNTQGSNISRLSSMDRMHQYKHAWPTDERRASNRRSNPHGYDDFLEDSTSRFDRQGQYFQNNSDTIRDRIWEEQSGTNNRSSRYKRYRNMSQIPRASVGAARRGSTSLHLSQQHSFQGQDQDYDSEMSICMDSGLPNHLKCTTHKRLVTPPADRRDGNWMADSDEDSCMKKGPKQDPSIEMEEIRDFNDDIQLDTPRNRNQKPSKNTVPSTTMKNRLPPHPEKPPRGPKIFTPKTPRWKMQPPSKEKPSATKEKGINIMKNTQQRAAQGIIQSELKAKREKAGIALFGTMLEEDPEEQEEEVKIRCEEKEQQQAYKAKLLAAKAETKQEKEEAKKILKAKEKEEVRRIQATETKRKQEKWADEREKQKEIDAILMEEKRKMAAEKILADRQKQEDTKIAQAVMKNKVSNFQIVEQELRIKKLESEINKLRAQSLRLPTPSNPVVQQNRTFEVEEESLFVSDHDPIDDVVNVEVRAELRRTGLTSEAELYALTTGEWSGRKTFRQQRDEFLAIKEQEDEEQRVVEEEQSQESTEAVKTPKTKPPPKKRAPRKPREAKATPNKPVQPKPRGRPAGTKAKAKEKAKDVVPKPPEELLLSPNPELRLKANAVATKAKARGKAKDVEAGEEISLSSDLKAKPKPKPNAKPAATKAKAKSTANDAEPEEERLLSLEPEDQPKSAITLVPTIGKRNPHAHDKVLHKGDGAKNDVTKTKNVEVIIRGAIPSEKVQGTETLREEQGQESMKEAASIIPGEKALEIANLTPQKRKIPRTRPSKEVQLTPSSMFPTMKEFAASATRKKGLPLSPSGKESSAAKLISPIPAKPNALKSTHPRPISRPPVTPMETKPANNIVKAPLAPRRMAWKKEVIPKPKIPNPVIPVAREPKPPRLPVPTTSELTIANTFDLMAQKTRAPSFSFAFDDNSDSESEEDPETDEMTEKRRAILREANEVARAAQLHQDKLDSSELVENENRIAAEVLAEFELGLEVEEEHQVVYDTQNSDSSEDLLNPVISNPSLLISNDEERMDVNVQGLDDSISMSTLQVLLKDDDGMDIDTDTTNIEMALSNTGSQAESKPESEQTWFFCFEAHFFKESNVSEQETISHQSKQYADLEATNDAACEFFLNYLKPKTPNLNHRDNFTGEVSLEVEGARDQASMKGHGLDIELNETDGGIVEWMEEHTMASIVVKSIRTS